MLREIAALNPAAEMIVEPDAGAPPPAARATTPAPAGPLVTETVNLPRPVDVATLETLLTRAAPALVRAKGTVRADDEAGTRYLLQFAGGRVSRTATRYGHTQALVVIGHRGELLDSLLEALRAL